MTSAGNKGKCYSLKHWRLYEASSSLADTKGMAI